MSHFENQRLQQTGLYDETTNNNTGLIEFLSTHPAHDKRAEYLESMLKETLELRDKCNCPRLPYRNPIKLTQQRIEEQKKRQAPYYAIIQL